MKKNCRSILLISLVMTGMASANNEQLEEEEPAKIRSLNQAEEPIKLDKIIVTDERFSFEVATALNFVQQALETPRSYKREGKDTWTCRLSRYWLRFRYLECARGGDWNANMYSSVYPRFEKGKNYGTIWRSRWPVNKKKFEAILEDLPGPAELYVDFASLALKDRSLPEDAPDSEELDLFSSVYQLVQVVSLLGSSRSERTTAGRRSMDVPERKIIAIIEDSGMTLERYNRIVEMVSYNKHLENEVAFRLGMLKRPE